MIPPLSLSTWLKIAGGFVVVLLFGLILWKVNSHFDYIHKIEQQNKQLVETNGRLNTRVGELARLNQDNQKVYEQKLRQAETARRLAEEERQAAEKRATRYRSIRDEARNTKDRRPVDPVVQSTIDRLWDRR